MREYFIWTNKDKSGVRFVVGKNVNHAKGQYRKMHNLDVSFPLNHLILSDDNAEYNVNDEPESSAILKRIDTLEDKIEVLESGMARKRTARFGRISEPISGEKKLQKALKEMAAIILTEM